LAIARYIKENPSQRIAIDSSKYTTGNQNLSDRRSRSIRDGLITAGVPSDRIQMGAYGDKQLMHADRTAVLFDSVN
jgi:outer membrane protein OmpA-like peptidoglycan-associated protein